MFQSLYIRDEIGERDVLEGGNVSCAWFVSILLSAIGKIDRPHATVASTVNDMLASGWVATTTPKPGDIVVWDRTPTYDHLHIGIVTGDGIAVDNFSEQRVPVERPFTDRPIIAFYTHPAFE